MQTISIMKTDSMDFQGREAYKTLRTNIEFSGEDVKVISVTSCVPNEGKSSVTLNLAFALAEAGKSVLFVDGDMRKSILTARYKIKNAKKGLSHYLSGQCGMDEIICVTNIEKFHMVVAGVVPPNPSELLSSKRFKSFLEEMRKVYDYVIIDCPPLGSVVDAKIVGNLSDGTVLVVAAEEVSYKFAQRIKEELEAGGKVLGAVLNKVHVKSRGYYEQYGGEYYTNED